MKALSSQLRQLLQRAEASLSQNRLSDLENKLIKTLTQIDKTDTLSSKLDSQKAKNAEMHSKIEKLLQQKLDQALAQRFSESLDVFRKNFWDQFKVQVNQAPKKILGAPKAPAEQAPAHYRPGPNDILLVAYPGSGLEELRRQITRSLYGCQLENPSDLDFFIPDLDVIASWSRILKSDFHFVKSFSPYFATDLIVTGKQIGRAHV